MNKIRLIFLVLVVIISVIFLFMFNRVESSLDTGVEKISEFKVTNISGKGSLYYDSRPISPDKYFSANKVDIKRLIYNDEIYLMTDAKTSFQFYCYGAAFTVLPNSYLYYQPKTKEFWFFKGEFFWHKEVKNKKLEVSVKNQSAGRGEVPQKIISLSNSGKLEIANNVVRIWNYSGKLSFSHGEESYGLTSSQMLIQIRNLKARTFPILHSPETISPERKIISLKEVGDSVVRFNWKAVKGAREYILRLYSSELKENILFEKATNENRLRLDLIAFDSYNRFYWQAIPYDSENNREGVPSKMGYLQLKGALLLNKEEILKPPEVEISGIDVNGNIVFVKGVLLDKNAQLFVNDKPVLLNMDGTFLHTISYKQIGNYKIVVRAVSASGIETTIEKNVSIYDQ